MYSDLLKHGLRSTNLHADDQFDERSRDPSLKKHHTSDMNTHATAVAVVPG